MFKVVDGWYMTNRAKVSAEDRERDLVSITKQIEERRAANPKWNFVGAILKIDDRCYLLEPVR